MADILNYGMVGGGANSFIGDVHRKGLALCGRARPAAGCFSSDMERSLMTSRAVGIDDSRTYCDFHEMAEKEAGRLDFVVVATPNDTHYECCKAFLNAGINIMCEKPLCFEIEEAEELAALAKEKDLLFGVMYGYSGNAMVKFARQLVADGKIGDIVNVNGEYPQQWLIDQLDPDSDRAPKFGVWRTDPKRSGISNCVGDIGTHLEHTVAYITGLHPKRVAARLDYFGYPLDLNANILVELSNGVSAGFWCSQIAAGHRNGLRVRIYGTKGSLEWREEDCEYLTFCERGEPPRLLSRNCEWVYGRSAEVSRIPSGHPEGYFEAFCNVYDAFTSAIIKRKKGETLSPSDLDFPTCEDGIMGVRYLHAVIDSGRSDSAWRQV